MKRLLVDGDILVYRAGFATNEEPVSHALHAVKMMLNNLHNKNVGRGKQLEPYRMDIYLTSTDKSNFRYKVAKTKPYKGNRSTEKPKHYDALREYLMIFHGATIVFGKEADDALSIENCKDIPNNTIVTIDKDLEQTPGFHYNFVNDVGYYVSRRRAYQTFCEAMLIGDAVDNIPGFKGIGPVYARRLIGACGRDKAKMIQTVYDLYTTTYDEDYFMEMGHLLWILREEAKRWEPDLETLRANRQDLYMDGGRDSKKKLGNKSRTQDTKSATKLSH